MLYIIFAFSMFEQKFEVHEEINKTPMPKAVIPSPVLIDFFTNFVLLSQED